MPAKNKMSDLRDHLFETLEALRDEDKPMDLDRAKTICTVAEKLIDSAMAEVKFLEVTDSIETPAFFEDNRRSALATGETFEDVRMKKVAGARR
jgi:hypothetical protein